MAAFLRRRWIRAAVEGAAKKSCNFSSTSSTSNSAAGDNNTNLPRQPAAQVLELLGAAQPHGQAVLLSDTELFSAALLAPSAVAAFLEKWPGRPLHHLRGGIIVLRSYRVELSRDTCAAVVIVEDLNFVGCSGSLPFGGPRNVLMEPSLQSLLGSAPVPGTGGGAPAMKNAGDGDDAACEEGEEDDGEITSDELDQTHAGATTSGHRNISTADDMHSAADSMLVRELFLTSPPQPPAIADTESVLDASQDIPDVQEQLLALPTAWYTSSENTSRQQRRAAAAAAAAAAAEPCANSQWEEEDMELEGYGRVAGGWSSNAMGGGGDDTQQQCSAAEIDGRTLHPDTQDLDAEPELSTQMDTCSFGGSTVLGAIGGRAQSRAQAQALRPARQPSRLRVVQQSGGDGQEVGEDFDFADARAWAALARQGQLLGIAQRFAHYYFSLEHHQIASSNSFIAGAGDK